MAMRFCAECNNMLTPKEDRRRRTLEYQCRLCGYKEEADDHLVYCNQLVRDATTNLENVQSDLNQDPTLQRSDEADCPQCHGTTAVFHQAKDVREKLSLIYVCCTCGYKYLG